MANTRGQMTWAFLGQVAPLVTTLVLTPFLLSHLGLARYGVWTLVMSVVVMLTSVDGGMSASLLRWFSLYRGQDDPDSFGRLFFTVAIAQSILVAVLGLLLLGLAPDVIQAFKIPVALHAEATSLVRLVGPLWLLSSLSALCTSALAAIESFGKAAVVTASSQAVYLVLVLVLIGENANLQRLAAALIVAQGAGLVIAVTFCSRNIQLSPRFLPRGELSRFWSYSWRMQVSSLTALVNLEADALIVGFLLPVRYVAFYGLGATAATYIRNLPLWVLPPLSTQLFQAMGRDGVDGAVEHFRSLHRRWMSVIVGYGLTGAICGGAGILAWLGRPVWPAAVVCAILTAGNSVNLTTAIMSTFARAIGRPDLEARYGALVVAVNIVLTVPAGLVAGIFGVVGATAVGQIVGSASFLRMLRRSVSEDLGSVLDGVPIGRCAVTAAVAGTGSSALVFTVSGAGFLGLLAALAVACVALLPVAVAARTRQLGLVVSQGMAER